MDTYNMIGNKKLFDKYKNMPREMYASIKIDF